MRRWRWGWAGRGWLEGTPSLPRVRGCVCVVVVTVVVVFVVVGIGAVAGGVAIDRAEVVADFVTRFTIHVVRDFINFEDYL